MTGPWNDGVVIDAYSRRDAIADGMLVDVTPAARAVGLGLPVALTAGAHDALGAADPARLARAMAALRVAAGLGSAGNTMRLTLPALGDRWVDVWVAIGPGDDPRPVLTMMLEGED